MSKIIKLLNSLPAINIVKESVVNNAKVIEIKRVEFKSNYIK